jgi:enamine deaminase RidA (YjgF/YER057c/UK114 family)
MSRHRLVNPPDMPPAVGYAHAVVAAPGRPVLIAGQIGCDATGAVAGGGLAAQFEAALGHVAAALRAAGAAPEDTVAMTIYITAMDEYRAARKALGPAWRAHFGSHYPAMAVVGVTELFEPAALVEIAAVAVIP